MHQSLQRMLIALLSLAIATAASAQSPRDALRALFDEHQEWRLSEYPQFAMEHGDYRSADKLDDESLAAIERRYDAEAKYLERLRSLDRAALGPADQLDYDLFEQTLARGIEGRRFRTFLAPINGRSGPHQEIPQLHERVRFNGLGDYENYLKRLEQVPRQIDQFVERLKLGLSEGRTPPKVTVEGVPAQIKSLVDGGLRALAEPLDYSTARITDAERAAIKKHFEEVSYPAVRSAMQKLGQFIDKDYLPGCREKIAATAWPDGDAFYAFQLRTMTTTDLSAQQIHEIGLAEVKRIRGEMMGVIRRTDYLETHPDAKSIDDEALFKRFIAYLRTDKRFYHESAEGLLQEYRDVCKRIDAELPRLFRVLPRQPYGVKPIPAFMAPHQTTAYYQRGDLRNGQPGYFYANTFALDQRPRYEMMALSLHEAVPGHHFQIAIAQELDDVPEFRKDLWYTAFGEGWALYCERLGLEVGLYTSPYDDFGRLLYEMWRSCRLVVDTGMHALDWPRDKAVAFMLENTALSELNINVEVDRYIAWPGQATAYKIGELKIRELRARAEQKLGSNFDVREFHEVVLGGGCVPLNLLEKRVDLWVAGKSGSK